MTEENPNEKSWFFNCAALPEFFKGSNAQSSLGKICDEFLTRRVTNYGKLKRIEDEVAKMPETLQKFNIKHPWQTPKLLENNKANDDLEKEFKNRIKTYMKEQTTCYISQKKLLKEALVLEDANLMENMKSAVFKHAVVLANFLTTDNITVELLTGPQQSFEKKNITSLRSWLNTLLEQAEKQVKLLKSNLLIHKADNQRLSELANAQQRNAESMELELPNSEKVGDLVKQVIKTNVLPELKSFITSALNKKGGKKAQQLPKAKSKSAKPQRPQSTVKANPPPKSNKLQTGKVSSTSSTLKRKRDAYQKGKGKDNTKKLRGGRQSRN